MQDGAILRGLDGLTACPSQNEPTDEFAYGRDRTPDAARPVRDCLRPGDDSSSGAATGCSRLGQPDKPTAGRSRLSTGVPAPSACVLTGPRPHRKAVLRNALIPMQGLANDVLRSTAAGGNE